MPDLWIPNAGVVDTDALSLGNRLKEYDERLFLFKKDDGTGYGVFFKVLRESQGGIYGDKEFLEILHLGHTLPHWDHVREMLYKKDLKARGVDEILNEIDSLNEQLQARNRRKADEAVIGTAEALESFAHRQGEVDYHRSLPKKDPKHRNMGKGYDKDSEVTHGLSSSTGSH